MTLPIECEYRKYPVGNTECDPICLLTRNHINGSYRTCPYKTIPPSYCPIENGRCWTCWYAGMGVEGMYCYHPDRTLKEIGPNSKKCELFKPLYGVLENEA